MKQASLKYGKIQSRPSRAALVSLLFGARVGGRGWYIGLLLNPQGTSLHVRLGFHEFSPFA
jgi:hypothetical protein